MQTSVSHLSEIAAHTIGVESLSIGSDVHVKLGFDATSPNLHLGHLVPLRAFKSLMEEGCQGTIILGDSTARIGDPSGQDKSRPILPMDETQLNARTLASSITSFLAGCGNNWQFAPNSLFEPSLSELIPLLKSVSVSSMLRRTHFADRFSRGDSISLSEMICPVLQGWDSVQLNCDLEIGGCDQLANCTLARDMMGRAGQSRQAVMLFPLLTGVDGVQKMSKSLRNHISLNDEPCDVFGKVMSIPDTLIGEWSKLLLHRVAEGDTPLEQKQRLAFDVTGLVHGTIKAQSARNWFRRTVQGKVVSIDREIQIGRGEVPVIQAVIQAGYATSNSDARRLIAGGGVRIDGERIEASAFITADCVLQKGRRNAVRCVTGDKNASRNK